ncbi:MAG TPA: UDP-N-acetylmuramyl-tripeptide synthetase, partial [Spirochaetota bacterium]|nr:UDP-N-acetylmuramyl-tripeptide synthetase [Spirochaetota bacterium]
CCNSSIQFGERVHPRIASSGISVRYFGVSSESVAGQPVPDVAVIDETASLERTSFVLKTSDAGIPVSLEARGFFNVYNSLAAACAALAVGIPLGQIPGGLSRVRIPGRFELVENTRGILVAVDYAHTDDALSNLIRSARRLEPARVITVFGCGGDRDRKKRPLMGHAASSLSDLVIVTSDNPRSEDPDAIIRDIMPGIIDPEKAIIEPDRRRAIFRAVSLARRGDIVLIAGKGHEDYQIFRDRTIHFDDREVAREALS